MRLDIGVTDRDGHEHLRRIPSLDEASFGQPSGRNQCRAPSAGAAAEPEVHAPMFSEPTLTRHRLGRDTFRTLVTDLYQRRCAISGEKALPALKAAQLRPVTNGGQHEPTSGLLFRSDIHRLYDRGYVTVTPDYRFRVSRRLKAEFDNGEPYYLLARTSHLPAQIRRAAKQLLRRSG